MLEQHACAKHLVLNAARRRPTYRRMTCRAMVWPAAHVARRVVVLALPIAPASLHSRGLDGDFPRHAVSAAAAILLQRHLPTLFT